MAIEEYIEADYTEEIKEAVEINFEYLGDEATALATIAFLEGMADCTTEGGLVIEHIANALKDTLDEI